MYISHDNSKFESLYLGEVLREAGGGGSLKFFFCYCLTWDDVLDWHGGIVMQNRKTPSPVSPKGEKLKPIFK
jgi:hypothetical protein